MDVLRTLGTRVTAPALVLTTRREADKDEGGDHLPPWPRGFTAKIQTDPNAPRSGVTTYANSHLKQRPLESSPS